MCWPGDEPEITYEGPTEADRASLDIARQQRELYDTRFAPLERQFLEDIGEDLGGYAKSEAAANTAQQVAASKAQAGPGLAGRGQFVGQQGTYAGAHGAGMAAGVSEADTLGKQAMIDRNMRALSQARGLQSSISSTGRGMATQSTQSAIQASNQALDAELDRYEDNTKLMSDLAGLASLGAGNYAMTGKFTGVGDDVNSEGFMGSSLGSPINTAYQRLQHNRRMGPSVPRSVEY